MINLLVTSSWAVATRSKSNKQDPRDFKKLNKMCAEQGYVSASQQYEFRKSNDARIKFGVVHERKNVLPSSDFTFGKRNRPQTPVGGIIQNEFGERARQHQEERYAQWQVMVSYKDFSHLNLNQRNTDHHGYNIRMTQAQLKMDQAIKQKYSNIAQDEGSSQATAKPLFKLKRFLEVEPRTSTKRGSEPFMSVKPGTEVKK